MKNKLRNKWYKREILERFLTESQCIELDRNYHNSKLVVVGQNEVYGKQKKQSK